MVINAKSIIFLGAAAFATRKPKKKFSPWPAYGRFYCTLSVLSFKSLFRGNIASRSSWAGGDTVFVRRGATTTVQAKRTARFPAEMTRALSNALRTR